MREIDLKVLIIEDEKLLAEPIEALLKKNKYSVDLAFDGEEGLYAGLTNLYDIILLDIMLPKMDGFEVLQNLRSQGIKTPIIMLTARTNVEDRVAGLDFGADDYLSKPFEAIELLARMRALLRRNGTFQESNILKFGDVELDPHTVTLSTKSDSQQLTLKEAQLLELLIKRCKIATPKDLILDKLWDLESDATESHVEYHISRLRNKLKLLNAQVSIQTVRGLGYFLKERAET